MFVSSPAPGYAQLPLNPGSERSLKIQVSINCIWLHTWGKGWLPTLAPNGPAPFEYWMLDEALSKEQRAGSQFSLMSLNALLHVSKAEVFGFTARPVANLAKLWSILLHRAVMCCKVMRTANDAHLAVGLCEGLQNCARSIDGTTSGAHSHTAMVHA